MDQQVAPLSPDYWWTDKDQGVICPPLDFSFMKAASFDGELINYFE